MSIERVALDLCAHCLAGCFDHPNASGHLCLTRGCAMNGAKVLYLGLAAHVKPIATFHQQEAEAVLRLINAAKVVMDEADWLSKPFMELRDALAGVAGYDLAALAVGGSDAPGPLDAPATAGRTTDPPTGGSSGASLALAVDQPDGMTCSDVPEGEQHDARRLRCRSCRPAAVGLKAAIGYCPGCGKWADLFLGLSDSLGREAYTSYTDALAIPPNVHGDVR